MRRRCRRRAPARRLTSGAAVAVVGWALLAAAPAATGAATAPTRAARVVDIAHRSVGIVRRVESITGDVRTEEAPGRVQVTLAADVLFEFDKAELTPAANVRIAEVADRIGEGAGGPVAVVGYTDAKGTDAYNADLSLRRATAVRDALQSQAPATFTVDGRGAADPVAPNSNPDGSDDPAGRALNRRVTITFAPAP